MISCLVADDHLAVLHALAQVLTEEGFVVTTAQRGDEALEKLAETRPDVAVIDAQMPGLAGLELARQAARDGLQTAIVLYARRSGNVSRSRPQPCASTSRRRCADSTPRRRHRRSPLPCGAP